MNSIILIAACAVCLDQLFFRGRLASYVVDNLKGPKKKHTGHNAAPHTPNAGTAPRQTPEILVSKSYRCGLERTGADIGTAPAGGDAIFAPASEEKSAMASWNGLVVRPSIGEDGELSEPEAPPAPDSRFRLSPPEQNSAMRKFMRCSESWTSGRAPSWATPRPRSGKPSPTSTSGPMLN